MFSFVPLALTVLVDSYFWDTWPLWPELAGLYFNVYEGRSSEWGVSILLAYIKSIEVYYPPDKPAI